MADLILILHTLFILFVIGGQLLVLIAWAGKWQWARNIIFRACHLFAISFVVLEAWFGIICPLTTLENYLRKRTGAAGYENSFIEYWLSQLIFYEAPHQVFTLIYSLFFLVVLLSYFFYPPQQRKNRSVK